MKGVGTCLRILLLLCVIVLVSCQSNDTDGAAWMEGSGEVDDGPLVSTSDKHETPIESKNTTTAKPAITTTPATTTIAQVAAPHLVVTDSEGGPCLLATLNATIEVSYKVPELIVHETYLAVADIQLPEDVKAKGVCGENASLLMLNWANNTFQFNLTFTLKDKDSDGNQTWSLSDISITYDLSNNNVFPAATEQNVVTVERHGLSMFRTSSGHTHFCNKDKMVEIGTDQRGADIFFHHVQVAAFGVTSDQFPDVIDECSKDPRDDDSEEILVPLIIACCLSAVVIIIIIAYIISRKVQAVKEQKEYKQMP